MTLVVAMGTWMPHLRGTADTLGITELKAGLFEEVTELEELTIAVDITELKAGYLKSSSSLRI